MTTRRHIAARAPAIAVILAFEVTVAAVIAYGYGFAAFAGLAGIGVLVLALIVPSDRLVLVYVLVLALLPDVLQVAVGGLALTASRVLAAVLLGIIVVRMVVGWETPRRSPLDAAVAAFAAVLVVGAVVSILGDDQVAARYALTRLVTFSMEYFGIYYLVLWTVRGDEARARLVALLVVTMSLVAGYALVEALTGRNFLNDIDTGLANNDAARRIFTRADLTRARATFEHPIALGSALAMTLPLALHLAASARTGSKRLAYLAGVALIVAAIVVTLSRGAYIATLLGLLALFACSGASGLRVRIAALIAAGATFALVFGGELLARISATFTVDASINDRLVDYPRVWAIFVERPILGRGLGSLNPLSFDYVDNYFLKTVGELGALGVIALVGLFALVLVTLGRHALRLPVGTSRSLAAAFFAATVVFAFQTATFDSFSFSKPSGLFWIVTAAGMGAVVEARSAPESGKT